MGWSSSSGPSFTLGHGTIWPPGQARVSVRVGDEEHLRWEWEVDLEELNAPRMGRIDIPVDQRPVAFRLAQSDDRWLAMGRVSDEAVLIRGDHIDPRTVDLVTITDVEPYILGSRELRDRLYSAQEG